jgi:hypothetical protein
MTMPRLTALNATIANAMVIETDGSVVLAGRDPTAEPRARVRQR